MHSTISTHMRDITFISFYKWRQPSISSSYNEASSVLCLFCFLHTSSCPSLCIHTLHCVIMQSSMLDSMSAACRGQWTDKVERRSKGHVLAALTVCPCLTDRFQVAQIPEYKPVVAETKTSACREQRNSLFGGKPFYSSSIRRWGFQTPELSSHLTGAVACCY